MLFGKKKAKPRKKFSITAAGIEVFRAPLIEIPLKEQVIIEKSIEFFDDPEPCYIHRGAVVTRLADELAQAAEAAGGILEGAALTEEYKGWLAFDGIESIRLIEE